MWLNFVFTVSTHTFRSVCTLQSTCDAHCNRHWDELALGNELMTPGIDLDANPLTEVTVAAFEDLGYDVSVCFIFSPMWTNQALS